MELGIQQDDIPQQELPPITVINQLPSPSRRIGFKTRCLGGILVVGAAVATYANFDEKFNLPDLHMPRLPRVEFSMGNNPPVAEASVRHDTYETESVFNISCEAQISFGVGTKGDKDELMANGEMDKIWWGDLLLCGDMNSVFANVRTEHTVDEKGNLLLKA